MRKEKEGKEARRQEAGAGDDGVKRNYLWSI